MREELEEVIHRPRFAIRFGLTPQTRDDLLLVVDTKAVTVKPRGRLPVSVRDPKDNMVLATALGGGVDHLVTGDDDLLALRTDPKIGSLQIVTVRDFLGIFERDE